MNEPEQKIEVTGPDDPDCKVYSAFAFIDGGTVTDIDSMFLWKGEAEVVHRRLGELLGHGRTFSPIFRVPGDAFKRDAKEDLRLQLDAAETEGCAFVVPAEHVTMLNELLFGKRGGQ